MPAPSPFRTCALVVAFAAALGDGLRAQDDPADWPTYNHDVRGTRHNPAETTLGVANVPGLVELWRFPAEGSGEEVGVVHATPSIVDGEAYFGTATLPAFYKLDREGRAAWTYRNPAHAAQPAVAGPAAEDPRAKLARLAASGAEGIVASALVTEDAVYFGDLGGWYYALDRATGAEIWKLNARVAPFPGAHPLNMFFASPIWADGKLIIAGGALEQVLAGFIPNYQACTGRGFVAALDPADGRILWKYDVGPEPEPLDPPVVIEDSWGEHTFSFGPATSIVWSTPSFDAATGSIYFGTDVNTSPRRPTPDDPALHTRESCAVIALDARDGREKWVTQLNPGDVWLNSMRGYDPATGLYKDQSVGDTPKPYTIDVDGVSTPVVGVGCKNGGFYVLRADDGRIVAQTPTYRGPPTAQPEVDPRTLALPSSIGGLQSGCATDGTTVYTNGIDAVRLGNMEDPMKSGIPPTGGRVTALSLDTGLERWRHERPKVAAVGGPAPIPVYRNVGDPVASGIAVANGVLYFTAVASGRLVALDAATGSVLKEIAIGPVWAGPAASRGRVYVGSGNTLFNPGDFEAYFPKDYTGAVRCFGVRGENAASGG